MKLLLTPIRMLRQFIILAVVFLFPIFFLPITPDFYYTNKLYLLLVSVLLLFILWLVETLVEKKTRFVLTNATKGLLILALAITASTIVGAANKIEAFLTPLGALLFIFSFFFVFLVSVDEALRSKIKIALLASLLVLAITTIYHASGITTALVATFPFFRDPSWSPAGNMAVALVLFLSSIPILVQTLTQGRHKRGAQALGVILSLGALVITVVATLLAGYQVLIKTPAASVPIPTSITIAAGAWKQTKNALFGVGLASYMSAFAGGKPASINQTPVWNTYIAQATGLFAHIATTTGIVGLVAIILAWIAPILVYRKKPMFQQRWAVLASYGMLTILAFLVPPSLPLFLFWITLLLLMQPDQSATVVEYTVSHPATKVIVGTVSATVIVGLAVLMGTSYVAYAALYQSLKAVDQRNGTAAYQWTVSSLKYNPLLPSTHLYFSQINLELAKSLATKEKVTEEDRNTITSLIDQSIREAKIAIDGDPGNPVNWLNLGKIYETLIPIANGADQWAIASYQQAAIFDPTNPLIRFALGAVSVTRKDYDGALNYFNQAVTLKPDFANAYYNMAFAFKQKGDIQNQTLALQKALSLIAKDSGDYTKVMGELKELDKQKAASAAAQTVAPATKQPSLTTPPSGNPIIVPPLNLPSEK